MKKKVFSILLAAVLLVLLPVVALAATATVKYIDENGIERSHECIIVESGDDYTFEDRKWYAVIGDVTIKNRIINNGLRLQPSYLILTDGCKLTAMNGISNIKKHELIIYGQSNGTGTLVADASNMKYCAGIGGVKDPSEAYANGGHITVNGGTIIATGGHNGAGIGGAQTANFDTITINSGTVIASGGGYAPGLGRGLSPHTSKCANTIFINGGTVTARGKLADNGYRWPAIEPGSPNTQVKDNMVIYAGDNEESAKQTDISGISSPYVYIVTAEDDPDDYKIIIGINQTIFTNADSAKFASNADFSKFDHVEVDGKTVAKKYYTAESGSTVITFNRNFIKTLSIGEHKLTIVSKDGNASTDFTVSGTLPKTGDQANPTLLMMLLLASLGALLLVSSKAKKRNED